MLIPDLKEHFLDRKSETLALLRNHSFGNSGKPDGEDSVLLIEENKRKKKLRIKKLNKNNKIQKIGNSGKPAGED